MYIFNIDEELLKYAISSFQAAHNRLPSYIILNEETLKLLKQIISTTVNITSPTININKDKYVKYMGINVAICNALVFGEVDIK